MGGRRDGLVRLREGRYLEDGWIGGERQRETGSEGEGGMEKGGGEMEVWERRWLSCLFEDKSEGQCSEEVYIHKHAHTNRCVCALTLELMQAHTNTNTLTYSARAHSAPRRGGKRPRLIGCCRLISPRVAEQCMLGCLDTNAVIHEGMR